MRLSASKFEFGSLSGGAFKAYQSVPVELAPNSWHTIRMDSRDLYYNAYLDGKLLAGVDDWYGPRKGRAALEVINAQGAFGEFTVKEIQ